MTVPATTLPKQHYRVQLKQQREEIPFAVRQNAEITANAALQTLTLSYSLVLSFASFGSEIDLWPLNNELAKREALVLPTVIDNALHLFQVTDIQTQLRRNRWGILEPIPSLCQSISPSAISIALVPGLGFDKNKHRLGYGKGYYDRLLSMMEPCLTHGIGFSSQLLLVSLPVEEHDLPLSYISLY